MSKYDALWKHIAAQGEDTLKLTFAQVGEIWQHNGEARVNLL